MKQHFLAVAVVLWVACGGAAAPPPVLRPFETESGPAGPPNRLDTLVFTALKKKGLEPANPCSDEVFVRRVYLDLIGTLPSPEEVDRFLSDQTPNKRAALIDTLLARDEFADYWAMKWGDLLRVKAEFPINLWPNAVQAYHRWVHDSIRQDRPYDQFARELLTSSGSNFRVAPVNFYRAVQGREPSAIAEAVALTFMGTRLESWPEAKRANMAVFFSRIAYKQTAEWKEEIVFLDPAPADPLDAVFPDGTAVHILPDQDPREVFADWLLKPGNSWFARNIVNRMWYWTVGRGIIHEPDDIRDDNPPVNPELLAALERELVKSRYDLKAVFRLILNSRTYQQSSIPRSTYPEAAAMFACYSVRRLDAEVLVDAMNKVLGGGEAYSSAIPEPFSFIPDYERTIDLADGSVTSEFLEKFGRPARDTGYEAERNNQPTDSQRLHLLNSTHIQQKIQRSWRVRRWVDMAKQNRTGAIRLAYVNLLSRYPTPEELAAVATYFKTGGAKTDQAFYDLSWALINGKEFLYRH